MPEADRSRLWVELPTKNPIRVHLTEVGVSLHVVLICQCKERFRAKPGRRDVPAAIFNHGLEKEGAADSRWVAQFGGAAGRLVDKLAGALHLSQMPFRQREEVRRTHLSVVAKTEHRVSVSIMNVIAQ